MLQQPHIVTEKEATPFPESLITRRQLEILNNNAKEFKWFRNAPYAARRLAFILCDINVAQHLTNSEIIE